MKPREYMFVLITSICLILALISFQNARSHTGHVSTTQAEIDPILTLTTPLHKMQQLTADLQERIDRLDRLLMEYERITQEHYSMSAQLRDFGEIMDEIGAREQEGWERTHK